MIGEVWNEHPDVIFLAEAFTRPKVMRHLAKVGYSQSYSYFTWRNTKAGLTEYFTELTQTEAVEYMRPNLFANTPDILHEYLQYRRPARVPDPPGAGGDARRDLRHLRPALRAVRRHALAARVPRNTSTPRSTRSATGTSTARGRSGLHHPDQRHPPRELRAPQRPQPPFHRRSTTTR